MTSSISSSTTLDSIIKVNQLPDSAVQRMNKVLSDDDDVDIDEEEKAKEAEESSEDDVAEFDYTKSDASYEIGSYIKKYTSAISDFLTYLSEKKVSLGESSLKNVLKDKVKVKISKSAYNEVGMGEYYNLKKILNYSQSLNSNNGDTNIIKNLTNFKITV